MDTGVNDDPRSYPGSAHVRTPVFKGDIDPSTGAVTTDIWHLPPGGPYVEYTTTGILSVTVVAVRTAQQTAVSGSGITPPSDAGSTVVSSPAGGITVNGV